MITAFYHVPNPPASSEWLTTQRGEVRWRRTQENWGGVL